MTDAIARAKDLAASAHAGQTDALGRDYAEAHLAPIAAGCAVFGEDAVVAGWLHDILEDTDVTAADLTEAGFSREVVRAVESVTKRAGEAYEDLIERAAADPLGRYVKLVDNAWNIENGPGLSVVDPERAHRMRRVKYLPARERLREACGLDSNARELRELASAFRPFWRFLARTSASAFEFTLEVTATSSGGVLIWGEDRTAPYDGQQYNIDISIDADAMAQVRQVLGLHPLLEPVQVIVQNAGTVFGPPATSREITGWFDAHGIKADLRGAFLPNR